MKENAERCGAEVVLVQDAWGSAVDPQKLEDALLAHPDATAVAFRACGDIHRRPVRREDTG